MTLNIVDLPAPFGPTIATIWPSETSSDTLHNALMFPYAALTPSSRSILPHPFSAEIGFHHSGIVDDVHRQPGRDDNAVVEHDQLIADLEHRVHRVLDDHHGHAFQRKAPDHDEQPRDLLARKAGEDLVEQD